MHNICADVVHAAGNNELFLGNQLAQQPRSGRSAQWKNAERRVKGSIAGADAQLSVRGIAPVSVMRHA